MTPAITWRLGQPIRSANERAVSKLAAKSRSRPGMAANPRSPAPRSPGGVLHKTNSKSWAVSWLRSIVGSRSYGNWYSTARNPAFAAAAKRSVTSSSVKSKAILQAKFGIFVVGAPATLFGQSACNAASTFRTWSAWPFALTRFQCFATFPLGSINAVERITPWVIFPYMFFSPHAPYFSIIL